MSRLKKILVMVLAGLYPAISFAQEYTTRSGPQDLFATEISTARKIIDMIAEFGVKYSFQALGGILVVILGMFLSKFVCKIMRDLFAKKKVDVTVSKFMLSIINVSIIAVAVLIALGKFGITIAPFIAGISVIGFGTSFALQGPLSNYAAGITLVFTKPFKVGDIVEVSSVMGEVTDMTLARTELKTLDGTVIFVPNKSIIGEVIHNYSHYKKLDLTIGVSYGSDVNKAIQIVEGIIKDEERIAKEPMPKIGISEFADSSINIYSRLWCAQSDYWDVLFSINKNIFFEFGKNGIEIPFPQRDVHIKDKK